ncbi:uncharacterized protein LOC125896885 isoform X2 [Epinephelus fuscoguttatus]|uniref:uncharacterized protein LOC125896885 isoform X2 n=1 Tax=Epinephelus fuscoguttatus TaxID=293821 RepID=UPI0020D07552|nr:uncharacterized protein LOC125896885 isoform X2 [Epinephelus fuscoguttatus]
MFGFKWTQMSSFLMLLHLTAINGRYSAFIVRDGDDVTLPCENVTHNQNECENTNWLFSGAGNTPSVELVNLGRIVENAISEGLSVTADCSLVIKNVTREDVGRYSCRQFRSGQQHGEDAHVYLSVVTMEEDKDNDNVKLSCSVSTYGWCTQRMNWLFNSNNIRDVKTSQSYCTSSLTFMNSPDTDTSSYGLSVCQTVDIFTGKVKQFTFSRQSGEAATTMGTIENGTKATAADDTRSPQDWWRYTIVCVCLAALIITVVAVNIWTKTKGNKTQMDENQVHNIENDSTVIYENLGDLDASVRLH